MNNIFQTLLYQREKQKDTVLATIVWDDGSAPRGAGSQMLVGAEGLLSGTIGGGAVEGKKNKGKHRFVQAFFNPAYRR